MYIFENPVLQRELLANLRMKRAFVLMFCYLALLGGVVYLAWPRQERIDLANPTASKRLMNLFFLGQYLLASLMAPTFAAGAITGEKAQKLRDAFGQPADSRCHSDRQVVCLVRSHLAVFVVASLPIVVLCLPLGGVSVYEVLAAYVADFALDDHLRHDQPVGQQLFSTDQCRTGQFLRVDLALGAARLRIVVGFIRVGRLTRLLASITILPGVSAAIIAVLFSATAARLLHPPDVGSEGKEVVDTEQEMQEARGLIIQRGQFPDNLFAPAKRDDLLEDGANPVFDKEMHERDFQPGHLDAAGGDPGEHVPGDSVDVFLLLLFQARMGRRGT